MMKRTFLSCAVAFLAATGVFAQTPQTPETPETPETFTKAQMCADIDTLFATIDAVHPDMCAVYPRPKLEADIAATKAALQPSGDIFYFYKEVEPLVVKLGDGHTHLGIPANGNTPMFPFEVELSAPDSIFVKADYTQGTIPVGAQITRINHIGATQLIDEMVAYESGEQDFFRVASAAWDFSPLLHVLHPDSLFHVEYLLKGVQHEAQIEAISWKQMLAAAKATATSDTEFYAFRTLPDKNIGVMEFNSFSDKEHFKGFLDSMFRVLHDKKLDNLIIDIRDNGGGNSELGDMLFQYISPVPFQQYGKTIVKISDIVKQKYPAYNKFPNGIQVFASDDTALIPWDEAKGITLIPLEENPLRYTGHVWLLTSHYTFSSATDFSWAFQQFKMGTIVGEETGGEAVCFGDIIVMTLPNTKFRYCCSYKKFHNYGATDADTHGTIPDYQVPARDAMRFTLDLIEKQRQ